MINQITCPKCGKNAEYECRSIDGSIDNAYSLFCKEHGTIFAIRQYFDTNESANNQISMDDPEVM